MKAINVAYFHAALCATVAIFAGQAVATLAFEVARFTGLTQSTAYSPAAWESPAELLRDTFRLMVFTWLLIGSAWKILGAIAPVLRQDRALIFVARGVMSSFVAGAVFIAVAVWGGALQLPSEINPPTLVHTIIAIMICALAGAVWGIVFHTQESFDKIVGMHHD